MLGAYLTFEILFALAWLFAAITAIHCAHKGPEKGRTAWVIVIIVFPLIGAVAYWLITDRQQDEVPYIPAPKVPPIARAKSEEEIARAIHEELSAQRARIQK